MKRLNLIVVTTLMMCVVLSASGQNFYAGFKGGLNYSDFKITGDAVEQDVSPKLYFGIGGVFGVYLNKALSIQLEPMYLIKGSILKQDAPNPDYSIKASFIAMPLIVKFTFGKKVKPYVFAGPSFAYLLTSKVKGEIDGITIETDWKDVSKRVGWNAHVGCGVQFPLGKGMFFIEGRYVHGLTNFNKGGTVEFEADGLTIPQEVDPEDELFSREFQVMVGYMLPFGG